jgi:transposase
MATVTVLPGPERRRRWTAAEKLRIVEDSLAPGRSVAEVARRHDVHANQLHLWRRQARAGVLAPIPDSGCRFVPIAIASAGTLVGATSIDAGPFPTIELVLRNGRVLRLPEGVAPARAAALADALEGRGP